MLDLLSLSIAIGLVVSLIFSETLGRGAGGLVVPGYVAFYLTRPTAIAITLVAALVTYAFVYWLSQVLIIYGRRRTVLMILTGFALGMILRASFEALLVTPDPALTVIGYIIPGLLAIWFDRQGIFDTLTTSLTAAAIVRLTLVIVAPTQLIENEVAIEERRAMIEQMAAAEDSLAAETQSVKVEHNN